jgi:hypothetical protein
VSDSQRLQKTTSQTKTDGSLIVAFHTSSSDQTRSESALDCALQIHGRALEPAVRAFTRQEGAMLGLVFLLIVLWFLGFMTSYTLGGLLHLLLLIAIVLFLIHIIQGRSIGEA